MMSILSELFRGEYVGGAHRYNSNVEIEKAYTRTEQLEKALKKTLNENQLAEFKEYLCACEKRNFLTSEQDFISGFQLAIKLIAEGIGK